MNTPGKRTPTLTDRRIIGRGVRRPECVQCLPDGRALCSDVRGGICAVTPDDTLEYLGGSEVPGLVSNGFGILSDGTAVFANVGSKGGIWSMDPDGAFTPLVEYVEGTPNFVLIRPGDEIWFSVLTAAGHTAPLSETRNDGYIARIKNGAVEIMAEGLITANEFKIDDARSVLYINETFARHTTCFDIAGDGTLSNRRIFAQYERDTFPDGLCLDANGDIWVPSIVSNRILHVTTDGGVNVIYEEYEHERVGAIQAALTAGTLTRDLIYQDTQSVLNNPSSLAFGGPDLSTLFVGSITNRYLCTFTSSVPGAPMTHWT
ncbi:MAG: SMP-30/gluconolactonase/LRE family protein [Pseudomonadota bacterium]